MGLNMDSYGFISGPYHLPMQKLHDTLVTDEASARSQPSGGRTTTRPGFDQPGEVMVTLLIVSNSDILTLSNFTVQLVLEYKIESQLYPSKIGRSVKPETARHTLLIGAPGMARNASSNALDKASPSCTLVASWAFKLLCGLHSCPKISWVQTRIRRILPRPEYTWNFDMCVIMCVFCHRESEPVVCWRPDRSSDLWLLSSPSTLMWYYSIWTQEQSYPLWNCLEIQYSCYSMIWQLVLSEVPGSDRIGCSKATSLAALRDWVQVMNSSAVIL